MRYFTIEWMPAPDGMWHDRHKIFEWAVARGGVVLGSVEAFEMNGPYYGNLGAGFDISMDCRTGAISTLQACRHRVECTIFQVLNELCESHR